MKRLTGWMVVLSLFLFTAAAVTADQDTEKQKKLLEAAKIELNNMEWKIKLSPIGGTNAQGYEDTLLFVDSKFSSEKLESDKFPVSNYTVSLKGEDVIIWETMQTGEDAGVAFWRGELENNIMRGVLSVHPDENTHMDFSFYSIQRKELEPKPPQIEEVKKESTPEPVKPEEIKKETTETTEESPAQPKKKHWWQR